ncbi:hypothetical protein DesfrDRAFT_1603 [Solidesulfovibrio fructosivorans JJ]]|uniref:Uncharacterized protein n=1 Tax=Solidesulfovibrio fructosivorans JJ] TaxID=596151 RepID=E1JVF4_SOLFR|nr:hypothetical protein [Solidesulfovibrio fructosivorans]EFL51748.1 hypothetical protein DesfrDRAFT_1603 [Solidesulfovibrio fructosivorans JJ]]
MRLGSSVRRVAGVHCGTRRIDPQAGPDATAAFRQHFFRRMLAFPHCSYYCIHEIQKKYTLLLAFISLDAIASQ